MFNLTYHAHMQAKAKNISVAEVLEAANNPCVTYPHRNLNQYRHIRAGIVAVVDRSTNLVITTYVNVVETPLRADQVA